MKTIVLTELQHRQIEGNSKTKLQAFQRKLYLKAKQNPKYKFYCLYDKVFRKDVLEESYKRVKRNKGSAGEDGMTFEDLENKEEEFLEEIHKELKEQTYEPKGLREVEIPKSNGKTRILKIPTIKDRVVQMAIKLIIEPIFEADFKECSYGYRPKRGAHDAIKALDKELYREMYKPEKERKEVKSIDLADCFNKIPQKELMKEIATRIIDRQMLKLIKQILKTGMMEKEDKEDEDRGTPQGGVLSPLLANIYLNKIDEYWEARGNQSKLIRYADDCVIILTKREEQEYQKLMEQIDKELKLEINKEKTKTERIESGINYLGFTLREKRSKKQKQYLSIEPSKNSLNRIREKMRKIIRKKTTESTESIIERTNQTLRGWQQYYDNIGMGKTRSQIQWYVEKRISKLIMSRKTRNKKKQKRKSLKMKDFRNGNLYSKYGLYKMENLGRIFA